MDSKLVSIIIPVYNAEKYVAESIQSAMNQTWAHKEIIVVDDGSTDSSLQIARSYSSSLIKIISGPNAGASAARNVGLTNAHGSYIQFLDADDLLSSDKIEQQMQALSDYEGYVGLSNTAYFNDSDAYQNAYLQDEWYSSGSDDPVGFLIKLYAGHEVMHGYGGMIQPNAWLTPRSVIDKAGPWNENLTVDDDGEFFCRVLLQSKGVKFSKGINYYRKFDNNTKSLSAKKDLAAFQSRLISTNLKYNYLKHKCDIALVDKIFARHYWEIGVITYPQYKALSNEAIDKAKKLGFKGQKYQSGKIGTALSYMLGWKFLRLLSYLRHKN
ncbi:MAG: glycosyltransferase family A protein [Bacteroidota bacterium]